MRKRSDFPKFHARHSFFDRASSAVTRVVGSPVAFCVAVLSVVLWGVTGPFFHYSDPWQLLINTSTTVITFLMVFVIQQSQNKDSVAVHLKLNELLASHRLASNRLVAIEDLDESELRTLRLFYCRLAELAEKEGGVKSSHSLDEADDRHSYKHPKKRKTAAAADEV